MSINQYPEWIKCNELNAIQSREIIALKERIKRLEDSYAAKDKQLSNLLHICRDNDIEVSSYDLIHGKEAKL